MPTGHKMIEANTLNSGGNKHEIIIYQNRSSQYWQFI